MPFENFCESTTEQSSNNSHVPDDRPSRIGPSFRLGWPRPAPTFCPRTIVTAWAPSPAAPCEMAHVGEATHSTLRMIALQEELDWQCYRLYGLIEEDLTQSRKAAKEDRENSDGDYARGAAASARAAGL